MSTFAEKLGAACDKWMALSQTPREYEIGNCRGGFEAGARAALRIAAEEVAKDRITSGSIGPLMDAGFNLACKRWSEELRTLASTLEGGT